MPKKCEFRKKTGELCGADAQTGKSLCVFHDPARAADGHRARRAGGIHRSRVAAVLPSDTPYCAEVSSTRKWPLASATYQPFYCGLWNKVRQNRDWRTWSRFWAKATRIYRCSNLDPRGKIQMKPKDRRLKTIELSLTPSQVVLLWLKTAVTRTYEEGARQSPFPRSAIANSVARNVRDSLKDKPEEMVEQAVLQARQEADLLYNLVVDLNVCVQSDFVAINREYGFLLGIISTLLHSGFLRVAEDKLKMLTLFFVERIFLLEGTISRLSVEQLGGQQVLFADSVQKLAEVIGFAEKAVDHFNFIAREIGCPTLDADEIRKNLQTEIDQEVARTILVARGAMLGLFGEDGDLRANYDQVIALGK